MTAEEVRAKRRAERQQFKLDRAQAFAASVAQAEAAFAAGDTSVRVAPLTREEVANFVAKKGDHSGTDTPDIAETEANAIEGPTEEVVVVEEEISEDIEHLQLTLQEAFFLLWSLDSLTVVDANMVRISTVTSTVL